jgi:hypothetical protein
MGTVGRTEVAAVVDEAAVLHLLGRSSPSGSLHPVGQRGPSTGGVHHQIGGYLFA